jgi:hypothetical protein
MVRSLFFCYMYETKTLHVILLYSGNTSCHPEQIVYSARVRGLTVSHSEGMSGARPRTFVSRDVRCRLCRVSHVLSRVRIGLCQMLGRRTPPARRVDAGVHGHCGQIQSCMMSCFFHL